MTEISPTLKPERSIFWAGYGLLSSKVRAALRKIERSVAAGRDEEMLRSLDRQLLQDIGVAPAALEIEPASESRSDSAPLREVFSWTRFAK